MLSKAVGMKLMLLAGALAASTQALANSFSFAIPPQQSQEEIVRRWTPIVEHLSNVTGVSLTLASGKDLPTFQSDMKSGAFDFAFVNPVHYAKFHDAAGYEAFARQQNAQLVGIIVVKKDSPFQTLEDIKGQNMAFPAPTAVAATILPMNRLTMLGIDVTPVYVSTMDNVYSAVARGLHAVGGGEKRTFESQDGTIRNDLRILWATPPFPAFTFSAHPRVPKEVVARVQRAMVELNNSEQGKTLLKAVRFSGIEVAADEDYNDIRKLKISVPE